MDQCAPTGKAYVSPTPAPHFKAAQCPGENRYPLSGSRHFLLDRQRIGNVLNRLVEGHFQSLGKIIAHASHTVVFEFKYDGGGVGKGGIGSLSADGRQLAQGRIEATMPYRFSGDEPFDVGEDTGTPVSEDYDVPLKFTGEIEKVVVLLQSGAASFQ